MAKKKPETRLVGIVEISSDKLMSRVASWDDAVNTLNQLTYPNDYKIVSLVAEPKYLFKHIDEHLDLTAKAILKSLTPELLTKYLEHLTRK